MTAPWKHAKQQQALASAQRDKAKAALQHPSQKEYCEVHDAWHMAPGHGTVPAIPVDEMTADIEKLAGSWPALMDKFNELMGVPPAPVFVHTVTLSEAPMPTLTGQAQFMRHLEQLLTVEGWTPPSFAIVPLSAVEIRSVCPHGGSTQVVISEFQIAAGGPDQLAARVAATMRTVCAHHGGLEVSLSDLARLVPALNHVMSSCPSCGAAPLPLYGLVQHLNDMHRWPREQIAGWLETLPVDLTVQAAPIGD